MSITSQQHSVRSSVYQTDLSKPLSKEAMYKAQLKYGIYQSPSQPTLGVSSSANASDTAALLAASTDLSIKPYKRDVAADAQTAALFAKAATITPYQREVADEAHLASMSAVSRKSKISFVGSTKESSQSPSPSSAAASALKHKKSNGSISTTDTTISKSSQKAAAASIKSRNSRGIGSLVSENLASLYEFDAIRNGTIKNSTNLDLSKINASSKANAEQALNERFHPEMDYRSGLQTESKLSDEKLSEFAGSAALASKDYEAPVDPNLEARNIYFNSLVDPKVLAKASLNADNTLKSIDSDLYSRHLFLNPEFNKAALAIAQKKYEIASVNTGKVNLGGGLFMTPDELDKIARKNIDPVLSTIDKQTTLQREHDAKVAAEKKAREEEHQKAKQAQIQAKLEAKRQKEEEKLQRRRELEEEKARQVKAKKDLEDLKKEELAKQKEILSLKKTEEARKKEELLAKKKEEEERIAKEAKEAQELREAELEASRKDRDEKLAPILAELQKETDKLDVLTEEKQALEDITQSHLTRLTNAKELLTSSETEITHLEGSLKTLQLDIQNSTSEQEKLAKEAEAKKVEAELAQQKLQQVESEALVKNLEIEKLKNETLEKKLALQMKLEEEKIKALNEEKEIIETLPPHLKSEDVGGEIKKEKAETSQKYTSLFADEEDAKSKENPSTSTKESSEADKSASAKSVVNASGVITPEVATSSKKNKLVEEVDEDEDGGEIKQTFSGFTQGSNDDAENDGSRSKGGYFKEEF